MKKMLTVLGLLVIGGLWVATAQSGDSKEGHEGHKYGEGKGEGEGEMGMTPVQVGPEHMRMRELAGDWKTETRYWMAPGTEPMVSRGTETAKPMLDGLALMSDYYGKSEEMGEFRGHGFMTWNVAKQKYQHYWMDNFSRNGPEVSWGTYDEAAKAWNWMSESMGPDGNMMTMRMVVKVTGPGEKQMEFFMEGEGGQEFKCIDIHYTR